MSIQIIGSTDTITSNDGSWNATGSVGISSGTTSSPGLCFSTDTNTGIYSPAADTIGIVEGGIEVIRIDNSGRVGVPSINTSKLLTFSTSTLLDVAGFELAGASATGASVVAATSRAAGTACYFVYGMANGVATLAITNNGDVRNTNNVYAAISDVKLKENIVDANSQWNDIKSIQIRKYNLKEGQTHTQIGVIAQEVELVSPGLVSESPDRDADGNTLGTVTKSVNYSVLYMKSVKALQEAMDRIETLEAKVAALEGS